MTKYIKTVAIIMICALALNMLPVKASAAGARETVKAGLYYGSGALISANLENSVGSGYRFGYFDSSRSFVELGYTDQTKITMHKDSNLYTTGSAYYESVPSSAYTSVGAYHIQIAEEFSDYASALAKAQEYSDGFPAYIGTRYVVRVGSYTSAEAATSAMGERGLTSGKAVGGYGMTVTIGVTGTNKILFEFDMDNKYYLGVMPVSSGGEKAQTWFKGYRYYGGFEYSRPDSGAITVINYAAMDDYLNGVISYEMSASWPIEALKAQALCARTYASKTRHSTYGFDVCTTTDCQVYYGVYSGSNADVINRAVSETSGKCVYYKGEIIDAVYHSSSGGATEDAVNVWGTEVAYLKGVACDFEPNDNNWTVTFTTQQLTQQLQSKGSSTGTVAQIYVSQYTAMGNALTLKVVDTNGKTYTYSRAAIRTLLGVNSIRFTVSGALAGGGATVYINGGSISTAETVYAIGSGGSKATVGLDGLYAITSSGVEAIQTVQASSGGSSTLTTIKGSGWGHNVGMSQWGANGLATQGKDAEYIIKYFFIGVTIS